MQHAFDWDDLRFFLAAARSGTLAAAGQRLGVDSATVGRRVTRLESAVKATLIIRTPSGLQLTAAGAQMFQRCETAEAAIDLAARSATRDLVAGTVRISAAEGFGTAILAPNLPDLAHLRPGLRIELAAHAGFLSPSRRQVDLAITLSPPEGSRLVIEPLTEYQLALYAAPDYIEQAGAPLALADLSRMRMVGYVDDLLYAPELRYLDEILPGLAPALSSSSIQAQRAIVAAGGGVGVLPCFLAAGLVRLLPDHVLLKRRFWLSTHQDVHGTARMRAVIAWLRGLAEANRERLVPFSGRTPAAA